MDSPMTPVLVTLLALAAALPARTGEIPAPEELPEELPEEPTRQEPAPKRESGPVLAVEPAPLSAGMKPGEPLLLGLTVRNAGGETLAWHVLSAPEWARLDVLSGELGFGDEKKLVIVVEPGAIPEGGLEGQIVIVAPDAKGSPAKFRIRAGRQGAAEEGAGEEGAVVTIEPEVEAPVPPAEIPEAAPVPPIARRGGLGVRAGVLLPAAGETADHAAAAILSLTYSPGCRGASKVSYELGIDYARTEAPDTGVLSNVGIARADLLYAPGGPTGIPYLLAGVEGILTGTGSETSYAGAVNVGVGMALAGGRFDLRVTQSMLVGSTNVQELTVVTLGARF